MAGAFPRKRPTAHPRARAARRAGSAGTRRTDIPHIIAWAKGGTTRLRDLISLREAHHVIVLARGYLITPTADTGGFTFTRPDGQPLPHGPVLPGSDGDLAA